jgi:hypothetical protein
VETAFGVLDFFSAIPGWPRISQKLTFLLMPFDSRDITTFEQVNREVEQFEQILRRSGIEIIPGSPLEAICINLLDLEQRQEQPDMLGEMEDLRLAYRPALGFHDILRRIVRLGDHPDFPVVFDHLRLLNAGTLAQNVAAPTDQVAAKIFELLIGLICLEIGTDVRLDGPATSYGDNPDVIVNIGGRRWGFACKVLGGHSPITMFERLEEGVKQIEQSHAEIGCVVFNLKNQIDHDETWAIQNPAEYAAGKDTPIYRYWRNLNDPLNVLRSLARQRQDSLEKVNGVENIRKLFAGRKSIPGALLFLQTAIGLKLPDEPLANMVLGLFSLMDLCGVSSGDFAVLHRLNDAMHHR